MLFRLIFLTSPSPPPDPSRAPQISPSLYTPPAAALWWGALPDALLAAAARGCEVRLLISKWAHTNPRIAPFLAALRWL